MTEALQQPASPADDGLATLMDAEAQRQAARMAQDAFAQIFRFSVEGDAAAASAGVAALTTQLRNWNRAAPDDAGRALRLALLVAGMDQWGLAYTQAFGLTAIPALSALLGNLRTGLDARDDARFQQFFSALSEREADGIDFKIELRRGIHLALWHAMIASEEREEALRILNHLGSLLLSLTKAMPQLGWRLVADAVAHIQLRCLADGLAADGLAQETNQSLFNALGAALPKEDWDRILAHATRAVLAWQQGRPRN